jgi:hypothetical protein
VTERLAYGQCRRCAADTVDSTYRCAHCGSDDVELFHMPVVYGASSTTDTAAFDGDEPAHDPAAAPNTRDVHHDHSAIMLPAAVVLALVVALLAWWVPTRTVVKVSGVRS